MAVQSSENRVNGQIQYLGVKSLFLWTQILDPHHQPFRISDMVYTHQERQQCTRLRHLGSQYPASFKRHYDTQGENRRHAPQIDRQSPP